MIALLVMTDGRDELLKRTIVSALTEIRGSITRLYLHTDAGPSHREALSNRWRDWQVIGDDRLGFGGAINRAWWEVSQAPVRFVFHLEDDFTFNRLVDLQAMADVLDAYPYLAQMALRRQPWNAEEEQAGGIVEQWPESYEDREWNGHQWLEHRLFFTTNPSLIPVTRCAQGWPNVKGSEAIYSRELFTDPEARSAFWGARDSGEWVHHIGTQRVGVGY